MVLTYRNKRESQETEDILKVINPHFFIKHETYHFLNLLL